MVRYMPTAPAASSPVGSEDEPSAVLGVIGFSGVAISAPL